MLYSKYLEKVLGNRTKIVMLRAFSRIPEKVWTSRGLAHFLGTYNTTVLDNLGDLEEMGLLDLGMHGHVKTIKFNRESFVFKEIVKPLFGAERKTLDILIEDLKSAVSPKDVSLFALFGSIAEHSERSNSDIDVIIVTENKDKIEKSLEEAQYSISKKFGNELSPFVLSPTEFKAKQDTSFIKEAKKNHIVLHGKWL